MKYRLPLPAVLALVLLSSTPTLRASKLPPGPPTLDQAFADIAAEVPEFGGLYIDDDGMPAVVLTDLGALADAEEAVFARFSPERLRADILNPVRGRFGFGQLHAYRMLARDFLTLPGVLGLDADEAVNRLRITVDSAAAQDAVASALEPLGIPAGAAVVEVAAPLRSFQSTFQEHHRPLAAGLKLGGGCTLGPIVELKGVRGYLTSAHCTPTVGANDETLFFQPSAEDPGWTAGTEALDPPLVSSADDPRCPEGAACRLSDSVFVATSSETTTSKGTIHSEPPASPLRVAGKEHLPLAGERVSKSGQATGHTTGRIRHTCQDLWNADAGVLLLCQYLADLDGAEGDSGAPVYAEIEPDQARLYGMVWGGTQEPAAVAFSGFGGLEAELGPLDVLYGLDNVGPDVWIDFPVLLTNVVVGVDTMFVGDSFDPDLFSALPCSQLTWTTDVAGDPVYTGCTPLVRYDTVGPRDLTLTGVDAMGETGVAVTRFEVVPLPTGGPPIVTILEPASGTMLWRDDSIDLVGKAKDPDGLSPIQYEWVVKGSHVIGGPEVVIATDSGPDDQALAPFSWTPANDVYFTCGGSSVVLELRATDADGEQSSTEIPLYILDIVC